jgi:hypothetical protein
MFDFAVDLADETSWNISGTFGRSRDVLVAQSFLLSAAARTLSLKSIFVQGEEAAYRRFCRLRWPETDGRSARLADASMSTT